MQNNKVEKKDHLDRFVAFCHHIRKSFKCAKEKKDHKRLVNMKCVCYGAKKGLGDHALVEGWFADCLFHFETANQRFESLSFFLFGLEELLSVWYSMQF